MRLRILLIQPPIHRKRPSSINVEPLALEAVAGAVPQCDISILDMRFDKLSLDDHLKMIDPHIVGITGYTADVYNMLKILKKIKQFNKDIITVVGGTHATLVPQDFYNNTVNAIVIGLGEIAFREIVEAVENKEDFKRIKGLAIPEPNSLFFTEERNGFTNLDEMPFPRRDLTEKYRRKYKVYGMIPASIISSAKGCPNRCRFCSIHELMKGKYLTKSPERIFEEILAIPQKHIRFVDGNTFGDTARMEKLYSIVKKSGLKKNFIFDIRCDTIVKNEKLIEQWRSIGFKAAAVGLEVINNEKLKYYNKGSSNNYHEEALKILHRNKIKIIGQFIIDQDSTEEYFKDLAEFVIKNKIHIASYTLLTPFPGTTFFKEKKNELITENYEHFDATHNVLPTRLDRENFAQQFVNLYRTTYSFKRFFIHLKDKFLDLINVREETRKDIPLYILILFKISLFMSLKEFKKRILL